nr:MFS transporter [Alloactinosynnema sp. L-07]
MRAVTRQYRSFGRPVRLLCVNQLGINTGFYLLMPYLADHLAVDLGMAVWLVGLVLGVRNLAQQGMFLVGGTLADRFGVKRMIVAGCALRTVGFALLAAVHSTPALIVASAATGFAGALFNPAARAYLALDAGGRRVEAFALFNVFYQAGVLVGPLLGLALVAVDFRLAAGVAAAVFACLTVLQWRALPARPPEDRSAGSRSVLADWRRVVGNRAFRLFSLTMIGTSVLSFQVYLALPLEIRRVAGSEQAGVVGTAALFVASGLVAVLGQVRLTAWCKRRLRPARTMVLGAVLMGSAFLPTALTALLQPPAPADGWIGQVGAFAPAVIGAALLTAGTTVLYPFEMDTVVGLSGGTLVATHYGFYNTVAGIGIAAGNLGVGGVLDVARDTGIAALPWLVLIAVAAASAAGLVVLDRGRHLGPAHVAEAVERPVTTEGRDGAASTPITGPAPAGADRGRTS